MPNTPVVATGRRFYRPIEVAELLGVSVHSVRRLARERKIRSYRWNSSVLIDPADLEEYLAANAVEKLPPATRRR